MLQPGAQPKCLCFYSIFWLPQIKAQTKRLLFIFYTQVPFWFCQIETQLFFRNSQFQNQMWGVSKPLVQNVHSETEQGHTSHVLPTLASKTNSVSPCLWPSLRYILPPHHLFAPDVTGSDLPTDGEVTGSHMRLMIKSPISLPFCFVFDQRQFPTLWLGPLVFLGGKSHEVTFNWLAHNFTLIY